MDGTDVDPAGIQTLVKVHPYRLAAHASDLLQAMPGGQHIVVQKDDFPAVRALTCSQVAAGWISPSLRGTMHQGQ